jgi:DNA-binding CsgD family transcriptional regulator
MILKGFSRPDANYILELINRSTSCSVAADIKQIAHDLRDLISYEYAVCGFAKIINLGYVASYEVVNVSYPEEWLSIYAKNKYHQIDPIVKKNFSQFELQYWEQTLKKSAPPREFLSAAHDFGLMDGYTYGIRSRSGKEGSLFSIAGRRLKKDLYTEAVLQHIMPHFHQALERLTNRQNGNRNADVYFISPREKEVLNWVSQGKNSWDISVILGISERTVNYHVDNVKQKLDAGSRTHAVAIAIDHGLIGVE